MQQQDSFITRYEIFLNVVSESQIKFEFFGLFVLFYLQWETYLLQCVLDLAQCCVNLKVRVMFFFSSTLVVFDGLLGILVLLSSLVHFRSGLVFFWIMMVAFCTCINTSLDCILKVPMNSCESKSRQSTTLALVMCKHPKGISFAMGKFSHCGAFPVTWKTAVCF